MPKTDLKVLSLDGVKRTLWGGGRRSGAVAHDGEARREQTLGEMEQRAAARGERR